MATQTKSRSIALLGDESLLGREIKEVLDARRPDVEIEAFAGSGEGSFAEEEGSSVYVRAFDPEAAGGKSAIVVAGSPDGAEKAFATVREAASKPTIIDCTGFLAGKPEARVVAPLLEEIQVSDSWLLVIAHPMASALALTLRRLARYSRVQQCVANIFEPASERGKRGIAELHGQTTNLLAFKPLDREVFDAQLAFNLLARYGEEAPVNLPKIEDRIAREAVSLLQAGDGPAIAQPSIRLMQAPVFHGYALSLWVEFESDVEVSAVEEALASAQIEVRRTTDEPPTNAGAASQSGLIAGDIRIDRARKNAAWIWMTADNLRLVADSVADLLSSVAAVSR